MRLLRMDSESYPLQEFEKTLFYEAGVTEIIAIEAHDPKEVIDADADVIAVIPGSLPKEVIEKLHHCKAILRMGTGYDKIDMETASSKGIFIIAVPDYCLYEVAEHAVMLMLASARKLIDLNRSMADGSWMAARQAAQLTRLHGKTVGIVGFGRIGQQIGRIASGMGMKICACDMYQTAAIDYPFTWVALDELLQTSDVVSLNCPLTEQTHGLMGAKEFGLMKSSAILINVARGAICDEKALAEALRQRRIAYAGIDVFAHINVFEEPGPAAPEGLYHGIPNVLLTPHYASFSTEAWKECVERAVMQMKQLFAGQKPYGCVNWEQAGTFARGR